MYMYNRSMRTAFTKIPKALGVSNFRAELARNLAKTKNGPVIIADHRGGESYVVLSAEDYNKLVEAWEDEIDSRELERLIGRKGKKFIPLSTIKP